MSDEHRTREPAKVVASMEIAQAMRNALIDGIEQAAENGWDTGVLTYEMVRIVGMFVRFCDVPPLKLEEHIEFLRQVYAGLSSSATPSVEEVLKRLCPESNAPCTSEETQAAGKVLQ